MTRRDPLVCAVWCGMAVFIALFWVGFAMALLPRTAAALDAAWDAVETAGTLNGCQTLNLLPGECAAWAEGGW